MIYDSATIYIDSATTLRAKIVRIDAIIDALITTALRSAASDEISEYMLNDGQTTIKTVYKGTEAIEKSIKAFTSIRQIYINQLNGRMFRLVDSKNFRL